MATALAPLYFLLQKGATWCWNSQHKVTFIHSKQLVTSETLLVHYDPTKELVLSSDASQYGVGAVLSQVYDMLEKLVAYVSRYLSSAEKNHSQLKKEGLGPVSYQVTLTDGRLWRRHQDQLIKATHMTDVQDEPDTDFDFDTTDTISDSATSTSQVMDRRYQNLMSLILQGGVGRYFDIVV